MSKQSPSIGFIGLGRVGSLMAANLLKAGFDLVVFDTDMARVRMLVQQGARSSKNIQTIAKTCNILMTSLPHPTISEEVFIGERGLVSDPAFKEGYGKILRSLKKILGSRNPYLSHGT